MYFEDLSPGPALINAVRHTNWSAAGALDEIIDNAFGPGKGNANTVWIIFDDDSIEILNDGVGFENINRMFKLASGTTRHHKTDIGQHGVGGTNASIWLADKISVTSKDRDTGLIHKYTVNWQLSCPEGDPDAGAWPLPYNGVGNHGVVSTLIPEAVTSIKLKGLRQSYVRVPDIKTRLSEDYAPGLRSGKNILVARVSKKDRANPPFCAIEAFRPELTAERRIGELVFHENPLLPNPLEWTGVVGFVDEPLPSNKRGAAISFGYRVIERTADAWSGYSPTSLYVEVELGEGWKHGLSQYKDSISDGLLRKGLMESIKSQIMEELKTAQSESDQLYFDELSNDIQQSLKCLEPDYGTPTGEQEDVPPFKYGEGELINPDPDHTIPTDVIDVLDLSEDEQGVVDHNLECKRPIKAKAGSLKIDWRTADEMADLRHLTSWAHVDYQQFIVVAINKDHPIVVQELPEAGASKSSIFLVSLVAQAIASEVAAKTDSDFKEFVNCRPSLDEYLTGFESPNELSMAVYSWILSSKKDAPAKKRGRPKKATNPATV